MKELEIKKIHSDEYDIEINCFLTADQIDAIAREVISFETYTEREQTICYRVLCLCTDIGAEIIENTGPNLIEQSGLWDTVKNGIYNFYEIQEAIKFYESPVRMLADIAKALPNLTQQLQGIDLGEVIQNGVHK